MENYQDRKVNTKNSQSLTSFSNVSKYFNFLSPWYKLAEMTNNSWWVDSEDTSNSNLFRYSTYDISSSLLASQSSVNLKDYKKLKNIQIEEDTDIDEVCYKKKNLANNNEIKEQDLFLLQNYNLYRYKVIPDGNCLYRALAKSLCNDQDKHMFVRKEIIKFIQKNFQRFKGYIEGDPQSYLNEAKKENIWGGYLEILASTELFDVNIIIVIGGTDDTKSKVRVTCHHFSGEIIPKETIWLSWLSSGHYDLVVDYKPDNEVYNKWFSQKELSSVSDEQLANQLADQQLANQLADQQLANQLADQQLANQLADQQLANQLADQQLANQLADEDNFQERPSNSFAEDEKFAFLLQLKENQRR